MKTVNTFLVTLAFTTASITAYGCGQPQAKTSDLAENSTLKPDKKYIKVALLLDTSNSMDGLINQAKAQLWDIVNQLSYARCENGAPNLQIALYEYGNDNLSPEEGYIRQVLGFTNDLDEISEKLFSLTTNGGEEFCGAVIKTSLKQLNWGNNPDDLKLIFIAGNEPFTQGNINYKEVTTDAKEKGIVVNTIFCGDYQLGIQTAWKDGAQRTGGDYMAIDHNRELVEIVTPYDQTIIILNQRLNKTYVPYGRIGETKAEMQYEQDSNAGSINSEIAVKRAVSKSSGFYQNPAWDLVDALKDKNFSIEKLKKEDLPAELKGKSAAEIKAYVEAKAKEREAVKKEIQELNQKRATFIAEQNKNQASSTLETAMIQAIKKQAEKKNYRWE